MPSGGTQVPSGIFQKRAVSGARCSSGWRVPRQRFAGEATLTGPPEGNRAPHRLEEISPDRRPRTRPVCNNTSQMCEALSCRITGRSRFWAGEFQFRRGHAVLPGGDGLSEASPHPHACSRPSARCGVAHPLAPHPCLPRPSRVCARSGLRLRPRKRESLPLCEGHGNRL